jgi:hypothetical protein
MQSGSVIKDGIGKFVGDHFIGTIGGLTGDNRGQGAAPFSITDNLGLGLCYNSALTGGTYHSLCFGHDSNSAPIFTIDGVVYPFNGTGSGNVAGPNPTVLNEIASWNSTTGALLRQGAAAITDIKTTLSSDAAAFTSRNNTSLTSSDILTYTFTASGCTLPCTASTYDVVRGVAVAPAATSVNLVTGVGSYVVSDAVTTGSFPATVGLFAAGVARANGAKVWGVNTLLTDTTTGAISGGTDKELNNELDFNVTSPHTTINGLLFAGASLSQPASAVAIGLVGLDVNVGAHVGDTAKWSVFLQANPGSTNIFAAISPKDSFGNSVKSQDINMGFYDTGGTFGSLTLTASEAGGLELFTAVDSARALTLLGPGGAATGASVRMPDKSNLIINNRIVLSGSGSTFTVGSDANYTIQNYGNASVATLSLFGTNVAVNSNLILTKASPLLNTSVSLTDSAAGFTATLTNAPVAGNPTKWIQINDNGTTRSIPTW